MGRPSVAAFIVMWGFKDEQRQGVALLLEQCFSGDGDVPDRTSTLPHSNINLVRVDVVSGAGLLLDKPIPCAQPRNWAGLAAEVIASIAVLSVDNGHRHVVQFGIATAGSRLAELEAAADFKNVCK